MSSIKVIIVDDDKIAADYLHKILSQIPDVKILDMCHTVEKGTFSVIENKPDLLFLDVEMPPQTGFDLVAEIHKYGIAPEIVFVTAYEKYAIKAIQVAALHYLLKPVNPYEVNEAIQRYKNNSQKNNQQRISNFVHYLHSKIPFTIRNMTNDTIFVDAESIIYCEADENYAYIVFQKKDEVERIMVSQSLLKIEDILPDYIFHRISRKHIINMRKLERITGGRKRMCIVKSDKTSFELPIPNENCKDLETKIKDLD